MLIKHLYSKSVLLTRTAPLSAFADEPRGASYIHFTVCSEVAILRPHTGVFEVRPTKVALHGSRLDDIPNPAASAGYRIRPKVRTSRRVRQPAEISPITPRRTLANMRMPHSQAAQP